MARTKNGAAAKPRRKKTTRRGRSAGVLARARSTMEDAVGGDVAAMRAEVDDMISALEERLNRLNQLTKRGAVHATEGANDVVLNAISGLTGQVTDRMQNNVKSVSDDVAKLGNQALKRVVAEIDQRPLLTLAIVAGIGFIAGLVRRSD